jgi:NitT/TauT family transport system permease protein
VRDTGRNWVKKTGIVVFWIIIWLLAALAVDNDILLSSPQAAAVSFCQLFLQKKFWQSVAGSFVRIALGFVTGFAAGAFLAVFGARFGFVEELLKPVMGLLKAVPVASFAVIFLIWRGSSFLAMAVCFIVVMPNVYVNILEGIRNADGKLLEMAKVFNVPFAKKFMYIYRPALEPFVKSALKVSVGMSWKSGVAAEIIGTPSSSIGNSIYMSKIVLDTAGVFAWTAVIILLSCICERLMLKLADIFFDDDLGKNVHFYRNVQPVKNKTDASYSLTVRELCKSFCGQTVLENVNAKYRAGEIYYLTSPSGSGKTTFFRILSGLESADAGSITENVRYSFMFQEDRLCENYSAVRNVAMVIGNEKRAKEALSGILPAESLVKPVKELSGGMKRRVALVRAMEAESDCVLLDEPFTGMDAATRQAAEEYIAERQGGRILIIATHI